MGRTRRASAAVVTAALLLGGIPGSASSAPCGGRHVATAVRTFKITVEWNKQKYRKGETAKALVTVVRPGEEDPLNNGIPLDTPERFPVEGASVTTTLSVNPPYYPWGAGITDAEGQVLIKIKLPKNVKGPVDGITRAWMTHNPNGPMCSEVTEEGFSFQSPALFVR